ncbi:RNA-binding protein YhbY [BD1-7 clade bacterium]|uniref:RNA-binding protein YhbY n=1 Tax=BD1-7 clade bacterium TaxID=2029982 RepID=A0A5S9N5T3_9GAMM|nr:RNA-binding protein YhbY [BD1-7 clade bacterium]CAA0084293.1 RNA-binding protein YhbY [BD1-7 clade bacterium]
MALPQAKIKHLRTIGHKLKPVVIVSENGLSDNLLAELERALNDHELIKVKFAFEDREAKKAAIDEVVKHSKAEAVQQIGKIVLLYRLAKQTNKKLSNLHRPI